MEAAAENCLIGELIRYRYFSTRYISTSFLHPSYSGVDEVICGTFLQGFYDKGRRGDSGPFYNTTFFRPPHFRNEIMSVVEIL